jgi:hypothetical protein
MTYHVIFFVFKITQRYINKLKYQIKVLLFCAFIAFWWVLIIIFFEILIPPEPFMRDAPHFFYRKYNKNLL